MTADRVAAPLDDQDAELMEVGVQLALTAHQRHPELSFVDLLTTALARLGWEKDDPATLWAVAVYADRFPAKVDDAGDVRFAEPETVLRHSDEPVFWLDDHLVALARRRAALPGRRRAEPGEPYRGG